MVDTSVICFALILELLMSLMSYTIYSYLAVLNLIKFESLEKSMAKTLDET